MTEQEYINKIHAEILEIMDVIHTVCLNNHLTYYLTGGSLLGAVRHEGFIPWDDDLDIAMPRDDYNRFIEICQTNLENNYVIHNMDTDSTHNCVFMKVCKKGTLFLESFDNGFVTNRGIFVDIFPLDDTNGVTKMTVIRKKLIERVRKMITMNSRPEYFRGIKKNIACLFSRRILVKILMAIMCLTNNKGKQCYTNFASQYPVNRKTQLKSVYGKGRPIVFENRTYMAPDDYEKDLLANFGPKYMELPPVEKRRTHYPVKVIFGDGSIFESKFQNINKVSVEDSITW